jgi:metal transporter CNNM
MIGQDATRIMLGALHLNSRKIGSDISRIPRNIDEEDKYTEKDVEKADMIVANGMIVRWSAVKTIDIDEPVDGALVRKIKSWSYSRIPVLGGQPEPTTEASGWNGKQIFGFLHIKVRESCLLLQIL